MQLDETTPRGRLIAAALKLAGERPWREVSLIDIAAAADTTLAGLRAHFDGKAAIVRGLVRAVDDELLAAARRPQPGEGPRDALFEVIMARLDLLGPHKAAIHSIAASGDFDPAMMGTMLASQRWMLQAAGIDTDGLAGPVRTLGLASLYASVFRTWLDDEDPGMARTMAALDRRLRRGERNIKALEDVCGAAAGFARGLGNLMSGMRTRATRKSDPPAAADTAPDNGAASG